MRVAILFFKALILSMCIYLLLNLCLFGIAYLQSDSNTKYVGFKNGDFYLDGENFGMEWGSDSSNTFLAIIILSYIGARAYKYYYK